MSAVNEFVGIRGSVPLNDITLDDNTGVNQFADKFLHKVVLARDEERREHRIVVIPTPSPSQSVVILHHLVGNETTPYSVNTE